MVRYLPATAHVMVYLAGTFEETEQLGAIWYPQIIHFSRVFHYKPSILGYPYFWKHPYIDVGDQHCYSTKALMETMDFPAGYEKGKASPM